MLGVLVGATASLWITAQVAKDRSWNHPRLVFSIFYTFFPLTILPPSQLGQAVLLGRHRTGCAAERGPANLIVTE